MVSVIVPIYNAERFLNNCVTMILAQNVDNMEILLVNDGSDDASGQMCDEWVKRDARVRVLHKANGGAASARNMGIDNARGEFLLFVDADDSIPKGHIATLLEVQRQTHADLVSASVTYVPGPIVQHASCVCNSWEFIELVLYRNGVGDYPVSKLYRRELFDGLRFAEGITSEDFEIFYRLYRRADRIAITDNTTYYYRQNGTSVSNSGFSEKFFNRIEICERLLRDVQRDNPALLPAAQSRVVDEAIWLYGLLPKRYEKQHAWIKNTIEQFGKNVLKDPKTTPKVKRKTQIFLICPSIWTLRMQCKTLLLRGISWVKNNPTVRKNQR